MKKCYYFSICFISLIANINYGSKESDWLLEWNFLNVAESSANIKTPHYTINVIRQDNASSIGKDSLGKDGHFVAEISVAGDIDYVDNFPSSAQLHFKLQYDTFVSFDSTFSFNELDFKEGYSSIYNKTMGKVSNKKFYIKVP